MLIMKTMDNTVIRHVIMWIFLLKERVPILHYIRPCQNTYSYQTKSLFCTPVCILANHDNDCQSSEMNPSLDENMIIKDSNRDWTKAKRYRECTPYPINLRFQNGSFCYVFREKHPEFLHDQVCFSSVRVIVTLCMGWQEME